MTLGDVGRKKNILMIFVPIWPKNDIRLEEHDFSNFLFFPDRLIYYVAIPKKTSHYSVIR